MNLLVDGPLGLVDPSWAMNVLARRRARDPRVRLARTTAANLPWPSDYFDGATAVNSIQLWDPLAASAAEGARVLRPGARRLGASQRRGDRAHLESVFADVARRPPAADEGRATMLVATAS